MGQEIPFLLYFERYRQLSAGMLASYSIWSPLLGMVTCQQDAGRTGLPAVPSVHAHGVRLPVRQHLQMLNELG